MRLANFEVGNDKPLFLIAGPCVVDSEALVMQVAETLQQLTTKLGVSYVFKASFDKANRTSASSYRGPGMAEGLKILQSVKKLGIPVLTDVHEDTPIKEVAAVVDVIQTPAFLCRQTNFIKAAASQKKPVNIKKGQFLSPWEMKQVVEKAKSTGNQQILVCERGFSFGYNNLVVDMRSLQVMKEMTGWPVIFDASHSNQKPGSTGYSSGGDRSMIPVLARAAVAVGIAGVFIETHPNPEDALSDADTTCPLDHMPRLLDELQMVDDVVKSHIG